MQYAWNTLAWSPIPYVYGIPELLTGNKTNAGTNHDFNRIILFPPFWGQPSEPQTKAAQALLNNFAAFARAFKGPSYNDYVNAYVAYHGSKFQTILHEETHLFLFTDDKGGYRGPALFNGRRTAPEVRLGEHLRNRVEGVLHRGPGEGGEQRRQLRHAGGSDVQMIPAPPDNPGRVPMTTSAAALDARDGLAGFAREFAKPPGQIYLDGNSLGLLCRPAEESLRIAVEAWRQHAILGWTAGPEPWFGLSRKVAGLLAPVLGAEPDDVMVGQSTTVNLHQLLATFYDPAGPRPRVLIDALSFPTDRYAVESHLRLRSRDPARDLVVMPSTGGHTLDEDRIVAAMDDSVGLAVLPSVVFTSGQLLDVAGVTRLARERGVLVAWDCSHSAGVVPHQFRADDLDLAFGCTYKYLNGGPGAVGYLYVHPRLRDRGPGLAGWFGCDPARQFAMESAFHPAADAGRFLMGTPHVLSLAPLVGSLDLILRAGVPALRQKSLALTAFLREHVEARLTEFGVRVVTPREDHRRGGHLTLTHPEAGRLSRALRQRGVIPDFRPPDQLRFAPAPLYTSFAECQSAIEVLSDILATKAHERLPDRDDPVT
jgi:kynureninase